VEGIGVKPQIGQLNVRQLAHRKFIGLNAIRESTLAMDQRVKVTLRGECCEAMLRSLLTPAEADDVTCSAVPTAM
jgi:hypothetical protein